ncbi:MAG: alpha/beta hydrolase [Trueperaceae bacterium]
MPFRIRVSLIVLGLLATSVLLLPLLWPVPPLSDTEPVRELATNDATWIETGPLALHAHLAGPTASEVDETDAGNDVPAPIAFVHGFGSSLASFHRVQEPWSQARITIAYDRPGFGLTERPLNVRDPSPYGPDAQVDQLLAVLDRLGSEPAVIVGHSAGASIALQAALVHPDRIRALVLVAPALDGSGGAPRSARWLLRTPQAQRIGPLLMRQVGGRSGEGLLRGGYADPSRIGPEVLEAHRTASRAHDWDRALWEVVLAARPPDLDGRLRDLDLPVLVVIGEQDAIVPPDQSERAAEAIPGATVVRLDGCGHVVQEECPERLVDAANAWLDAPDGR